jgi:hypothetical protein
MIVRSVQPLKPERLEELSTRQLLARLQRLRECVESRAWSDYTDDEIAAATGIVFKDDPKWVSAVDDLKRVLAAREHVSRPPEIARERRERRSKNRERYRNRSR